MIIILYVVFILHNYSLLLIIPGVYFYHTILHIQIYFIFLPYNIIYVNKFILIINNGIQFYNNHFNMLYYIITWY